MVVLVSFSTCYTPIQIINPLVFFLAGGKPHTIFFVSLFRALRPSGCKSEGAKLLKTANPFIVLMRCGWCSLITLFGGALLGFYWLMRPLFQASLSPLFAGIPFTLCKP